MSRPSTFSDFGGVFLVVCLLAVLILTYVVLRPFLTIFLVAVVLATVAHPVHKGLLRRTRGRENPAALLTCVMVVVLVIVPSLLLLGLLARESLELYEWINHKVEAGLMDGDKLNRVVDWLKRLLPHVDLGRIELGKILTGFAGRLSGILVNLSATALKTVTTTIWKFLLMLFALFYFLRDGAKFIRWVMHLSPLPRSLEEEILERFKGVSESAFYGTFLTALAQGFLGGLGFLIAGLQPLVWGVAMAFFSMIPVVGTAIVWGPAAIVLLLSGKATSGVFLIIWGVVVVGMSDNVLRPFLMKGKSELHPLFIFFSLLGGISAFGLLGIILGPLAIVLVIALLQAYEEAARPALDDFDAR